MTLSFFSHCQVIKTSERDTTLSKYWKRHFFMDGLKRWNVLPRHLRSHSHSSQGLIVYSHYACWEFQQASKNSPFSWFLSSLENGLSTGLTSWKWWFGLFVIDDSIPYPGWSIPWSAQLVLIWCLPYQCVRTVWQWIQWIPVSFMLHWIIFLIWSHFPFHILTVHFIFYLSNA